MKASSSEFPSDSLSSSCIALLTISATLSSISIIMLPVLGCSIIRVPRNRRNSSRTWKSRATLVLVRDSSAVRRLFFSTCWSHGTSESSTYGKQRICRCNSASTHFHVSWLSDFIFFPKPLYKSLHQYVFYSFITILPSESGVTLYYSTILDHHFAMLTFIFEPTNVISRY